ncbi:MAG TPA: TRAM domain-containing protein [Stellaceae bacterium]|nr:TRAM domain-containing protein [Stellaceae bacterium]
MRRKREERRPGELVELSVERVGAQGDGIASWRGEPVFLPFTAPGDRVQARLGARRGLGWEGRVIGRLASGPGHIEAVCRHFGRCGGCALQHLDEAAYRAVKLDALHTALRRVGIDPAVVGPLRVLPPARRRARFGLVRPNAAGAPPAIGFRERFSHALVDLSECAVLEPVLFALLAPLRSVAEALLPHGGIANVTLTRTDSGADLLIEADKWPGLGALEALAGLAAEWDLARIVWRGHGGDMPVVERRPVRVRLSGVPVAFPPGGFLQASEAAESILVEEVVVAVGTRRPVLDLFAGLGTFALALAPAGPTHAVEGDSRSAEALTQAAADMPHLTVEQRDLERDPLPVETLARYAAAVFDPPRAGARRQAAMLAASKLETIVAVSCNPSTFARDASLLVAGGFRIERVVPVDQFVWSPHLELAAVFRR